MKYTFYVNTQTDEAGLPTSFFTGFRKGDELTLAYSGSIPVSPKEEPLSIAESLFALFNDPNLRPHEYAGRSMSFGDIIVLETPRGIKILQVDFVGFKEVLEIMGSEIKPTPPEWIREKAT
jgi:hypothetical protein